MNFSWMAWTVPTAVFFGVIVALIGTLAVWERLSPGGGPRTGVLRIETTRGDRLFITLLGSAFLCLGWLGLTDLSLWWGLAISALYGALVFSFV